MFAALISAFLASLTVSLLLVLTRRWHEHLSADSPGAGPQKLHAAPTPRIGGMAVAAGFAVALVVARLQLPGGSDSAAPPWFTGWFIVALFIPFGAGVVEDITKACGARLRLLATIFGAAVAYYFCDASLSRFDLLPLDALLASSVTARVIFTLFCVGAIANAYNLADGLNGLLSGLATAACFAMGWIAAMYGDQFLAIAAGALAAAILGFLPFNFPRARLFAGDGGAYFIGSAISLLAILLCHRNLQVSPWFAFVLVLYPFVDTSAAIVRRLLSGRPVMAPDAAHMHTLLARWMVAKVGPAGRNWASVIVVAVSALSALLAVFLHRETEALMLLCGAMMTIFAVCYVLLWRRVQAPLSADVAPPLQVRL